MRVGLEEVKKNKEIMNIMVKKTVRVFSHKHNAYFRPGFSGYTPDGLEAGVWDFEYALRATRHYRGIEFRAT